MNRQELSFSALVALLLGAVSCQEAEPAAQHEQPVKVLQERGQHQYQRVVRRVGLECEYTCAEPKALSKCAQGTQPIGVAELLLHPEAMIGHRVSVRGRARAGAAFGCGKKKCAEGKCCNTCSVPVMLGGEATGRLRLDVACKGNDARVCCPLDLGREVVATGVLDDSEGLVLTKAELCAG